MSIAVKMSQNNANDKSFANTLNIRILQHNYARSARMHKIIIIIIIIINLYILVTSIRSTHEKLYAMCVEWTKFSEVENHSLSIRLLHAVETTRLRLCIKFVRVDCMLENECSSHSKLLQKLCFHHHSRCCSEIFRDRDDYSIVQKVNVT